MDELLNSFIHNDNSSIWSLDRHVWCGIAFLFSDISPDMPHSKEIYHKVKSHLGNSGIEDFYIRFQELHVPNDIVS